MLGVARADEHWRARIVTFPNILWVVPGGGETMKFYGRTEEQARRLAADFVREHCVEKGYLMRDEVEFAGKLHRPGISDFGATGSRSTVAAPRYGRRLPVRFGVSVPTHMGYTANLSETGLFIATLKPPGSGALLGLSLELEHCKVPLRGSVAWQRDAGSPVGEHGMGMKLVRCSRTGRASTYQKYSTTVFHPPISEVRC